MCLIVVLICIFLLANDIEHFSMWSFSICISFFGELFIQILCPFLIELFLFLLDFKVKYILGTCFLLYICTVKTVSHCVCCLFTFLMVPFETQFLILVIYHLPVFSLLLLLLVSFLRNCCLIQVHEESHLCFLLRVLYV